MQFDKLKMKSNGSIKNICIAAVERHTIKPIDFPLTTVFGNGSARPVSNQIDLLNGELPASQTFIDKSDWTLVATGRIINCFDGIVQETLTEKVSSPHWGHFKGYKNRPASIGEIKLNNCNTFNIHIEAGKASMIIIYSVMTLVGQVKK